MIGDQFSREKIEKLRVSRWTTVAAEIRRGWDDAAAKMPKPDVIGGDTGGEGIFFIRQPTCESGAAAGGGLRIVGGRAMLVASMQWLTELVVSVGDGFFGVFDLGRILLGCILQRK